MVTVAAAWRAMVSEKKSMANPNKKPSQIKRFLFSLIGYQYRKRMYTMGLINPKKFSRLKTNTWTRISRANLRVLMIKGLLIIWKLRF